VRGEGEKPISEFFRVPVSIMRMRISNRAT
jgi:hypothetical protein